MCYKIEHFGRDLETDETCEHFREAAKIVEYPVKIGDKVYEIRQQRKKHPSSSRKIDNSIVTEIHLKRAIANGATLYVKSKLFVRSDAMRLGKTVFLTREEAEKALAERSCEK